MTCPTIGDHEWSEPRIVAAGVHEVRGPWVEWRQTCTNGTCGRVRAWREWTRVLGGYLGRVGMTTEARA